MSGTLKIGGKTLATHDTSNNQINLHSDILATTTQVQGVLKSFSGAHSDGATTLTLNTVTDLSVGDYVAGEGIAVGVTVSSINSGNNTIVISTGLDLDGGSIAGGEPITFYNATKALSAGTVAGGLCRAYVHFDGDTSPYSIYSSFNVSSINRTASGKYEINFITAFPDENFCAVSMCRYESGTISTSPGGLIAEEPVSRSTTQITVASRRKDDSTNIDADRISVAVFR